MKVWNSTLERHQPLKSKAGLRSSKPIRPVNRERKARLVEEQFGIATGYRAFLVSHRCAVPDCPRDERYTVPAHVRSCGAGGTWRDTVPLCWLHHSEQHAMGIESFERKYRIRMAEIADRMVGEWKRTHEKEDG